MLGFFMLSQFVGGILPMCTPVSQGVLRSIRNRARSLHYDLHSLATYDLLGRIYGAIGSWGDRV